MQYWGNWGPVVNQDHDSIWVIQTSPSCSCSCAKQAPVPPLGGPADLSTAFSQPLSSVPRVKDCLIAQSLC